MVDRKTLALLLFFSASVGILKAATTFCPPGPDGEQVAAVYNFNSGRFDCITQTSSNTIVAGSNVTVTYSTTTGVFTVGSTGSGGGSSLAIGTGTASSFTSQVSTAASGLSFLGAQFLDTASGTTNFVALNSSSVTLLGPSIALGSETTGVYIASLTATSAISITGTNNAASAAPIIGLNSSSVTLQGVLNDIHNQNTLQSGSTFYTSSGTATNLFTSTININGLNNGAFPVTPLYIGGNVDNYLQQVMQNVSTGTNASGNLLIASNLGGNLTNYVNLGIVSSQYNSFGASLVMSTGAYLYSSDHSLDIIADLNGTDSKSNLEFVTGGSATSNIRLTIADNGSIDVLSSTTFRNSVGGLPQSTGTITMVFDNSSIIGSTRCTTLDYSCTISSWSVVSDSGTFTMHVTSSTFSNYPTVTSMSGSNPPSLTAQFRNSGTNSGWTTTVLNQSDVVCSVLDSLSGFTWANIILWVIKS